MGKPAARLGDMHTCPMVTPGLPPVPHVGGPITGPGCPTVLIGGLPAAVMGDMCVCVGPPDTIVLGSTGVLIGGKPAARMGDQCAHGGAIVIGCPTVLIGETMAGSPVTVAASGGKASGTNSGAKNAGKNASSLKLGSNEIYKDSLLLASERTGLDAAAIASIISAEAAKKPDKKTWDPASKNPKTSAKGLTQFLNGTWLDMAKKPGTLLNAKAKELGYISQDNKLVSSYKKDLLELRTNSELSIVTAAEYGKANLEELQKAVPDLESATDDEKAQYIYLAHHEGLKGAKQVLSQTMTEEKSARNLEKNLAPEKIEEAIAKHGSAEKAYRHFVLDYTATHIKPENFRSSPDET